MRIKWNCHAPESIFSRRTLMIAALCCSFFLPIVVGSSPAADALTETSAQLQLEVPKLEMLNLDGIEVSDELKIQLLEHIAEQSQNPQLKGMPDVWRLERQWK